MEYHLSKVFSKLGITSRASSTEYSPSNYIVPHAGVSLRSVTVTNGDDVRSARAHSPTGIASADAGEQHAALATSMRGIAVRLGLSPGGAGFGS